MRIFIRNKTSELIKLASDNNKLIVCHNAREAMRVYQEAKRLGYKIHMPISFEIFLSGKTAISNIDAFLFDDIDLSLAKYAKHIPIEALTYTLKS